MKRVMLQLVLLLAVVAGSVSPASAQNTWTSVGSAGTVDEAGVDIYDVTGAQIRVRAGAALPATLVVRYNIVHAAPDIGASLGVRFKDTGAGARVVAALKQVNFGSGNTTTVLTVDSNNFDPSSDFQLGQAFSCISPFDFSNNAYFIEAIITKSTELAAPALQLLRIASAIDC